MADVDTGGGNAVNALSVTERLIAMGVAGMNIEDQVFPKRCGHMAGKEVISADEMAGKVRACAAVRDRLDPDFVINARTDAYAVHGLAEAIRRGNLYLEAGADLAFIDGINTRAEIERAVQELEGPLSVNQMDAITGVKTELIPVPELARLGVGRVSIPVASIMVTLRALRRFFEALKAAPAGNLAGQTAVGDELRRSTPTSWVSASTGSWRTSTCLPPGSPPSTRAAAPLEAAGTAAARAGEVAMPMTMVEKILARASAGARSARATSWSPRWTWRSPTRTRRS